MSKSTPWKNAVLVLASILFSLLLIEGGLYGLEIYTKSRIDVIDDVSDESTTRIISIGESTAYGLGVEKEESYTALLDQYLGEKAKIYNLGMPAVTSTTVLRNLENNYLKVRPKVVIFCIGTNDLVVSLNQQNSIKDPHLPLSLSKLMYKVRIYKLYKILRDELNDNNFYPDYPGFSDELGNVYQVSKYDKEADNIDDLQSFYKIATSQLIFNIDEIVKLSKKYNVQPIFLNYLTSSVNPILENYFTDKAIPLVKVNTPDYQSYVYDGFHPNSAGHQLIADTVLPELERILDRLN